jgi:hypothetical protein
VNCAACHRHDDDLGFERDGGLFGQRRRSSQVERDVLAAREANDLVLQRPPSIGKSPVPQEDALAAPSRPRGDCVDPGPCRGNQRLRTLGLADRLAERRHGAEHLVEGCERSGPDHGGTGPLDERERVGTGVCARNDEIRLESQQRFGLARHARRALRRECARDGADLVVHEDREPGDPLGCDEVDQDLVGAERQRYDPPGRAPERDPGAERIGRRLWVRSGRDDRSYARPHRHGRRRQRGCPHACRDDRPERKQRDEEAHG